MRIVRCDRELEVERAARQGAIDSSPQLSSHVAACASCADVVRVSAWMRDLARATFDRVLPNPVHVWWKAQLLQRWESERRAAAPLDTMQRVETIAGVLTAAGLLLVLWPSVTGWLTRETPAWDAAVQRVASPATLLTAIVSVFVVIGMMIALTTWAFDD